MAEPTDQIVDVAVRRLAISALALFVLDQHRWSHRPCSTCAAITKLLGQPFGCDAHRAAKCERHQCGEWHDGGKSQ